MFITSSRGFDIKNFVFVPLYPRREPLGRVKFDELKDNVTMKQSLGRCLFAIVHSSDLCTRRHHRWNSSMANGEDVH